MTFKHVDIELPHLDRETIDGVRYYKIPDEEELIKLVSITSITSHYNKQIFIDWRKRVGTETADKITKAATSRGTDMHTLTEHYLKMMRNYLKSNRYQISYLKYQNQN